MYKELLREKSDISNYLLGNHIQEIIEELNLEKKNLLIIPPDFTRNHSYAGEITQILVKKLVNSSIDIPRSFVRS